MRLFTLLMGVFLSLISDASAGTIDPNTPDSKYLDYGAKFHNVVQICGIDDNNGLSCGSAVIIDPHWIVTAAHVVADTKTCSITLKNKKYNVVKIICHNEYQEHIFGYHDIAIGYVEEDMGLDHYPSLYKDQDEVDKICSMAGVGFTGTFNTGSKLSDGKKRGGSNFIDRVERHTLVCSPSKRNQKSTELEFLIAGGDSGGGLFIDGKLAGIHSSVLGYDGKPDSTYGDESCHTRVSLYFKWIEDQQKTGRVK